MNGGGIRPSAGVVLPLLPPALLHYTINRRKLQAVRQKICAKKSGDVGGCLLCRPPTLPLACFPAPYPPTPLPRWGRGRPRLFHARGFAPCIPGAEPRRHWFALPLWKTQWGACPGVAGAAGVSDTRRGACPIGRPPTLPLPSFLPPIPPTPFPGGEGGAPKFISPGASPPAPLHLTACGTHRACQAGTRRGGLPGWSPAYPAFTFFPAPYPPSPLPRRGRGRPRLFHARGFAPCIPAPEPEAALTEPAKQVPGGRNPRFAAKTTGSGSLRAVPAAKERGDRGRGTSAFEMVLSPGAG